jgi:hypothetical protein
VNSQFNQIFRAVVLAGGVLAAPAAFANVPAVQLNFGPAGSPTMTALFQNEGPSEVQLTITAVGLGGNYSLDSLYFCLNPNLDAKDLVFTQTGSVGGVTGTVSTANNSYKVNGGSGKFDISVTFGDSPAFVTGDSLTFDITGIGGLSVSDFLFQETASAGNTARYAAGSLQNLDGILIIQGTPQTTQQSSTRGVPDVASTSGLLVLGLAGIGMAKRKLRS